MGWIRLSAGDLVLELAPEVGGAIARFGVDKAQGYTPLMRPAADGGLDDALEAACFPLVPFCNRVRDGRFSFAGRQVQIAPNLPPQKHPLHGQGWRNPWAVGDAREHEAELVYRHPPGQWPWAYEARQRFDLDADGLSLRLSVRNLSDGPMPAGLGLHPYFPCDAATVLDTAVETAWTVDEEVMPIQAVPAEGRYGLTDRRICGQDLDNGFEGWSGEAVIRWPDTGLGLAIRSADASYFQVYSPTQGGLFVAEPVTHRNAALNLPESQWTTAGLRVLDPGAEFAISTRFEVLAV
jgi:aldose 1-epimerase